MRYVSILLIIAALLTGCKKKRFGNSSIVGHAGAGLSIEHAPYHDNSYESIHYALDMQGVNGVEVDVQISADGTAWLFHDPELKKESNGSGCIGDATDAYLSSLHYSGFGEEKLLRLRDIDFPFATRELYLDIRPLNHCTGMEVDVDAIIEGIKNALPNAPVKGISVIVLKPEWVEPFAAQGWDVYYEVEHFADYMDADASLLGQTAGLCMRDVLSKNDIVSVHAISKKVMIFDVRSPHKVRDLLKKDADIILADDLKGALIEKY
jgi:glycerophosphoryl diester phosphodiesterase